LPVFRRIALAFLLFSLVAAFAWCAGMLYRLAPIGSAYAAKVLCSGVFVSGRPAREVIDEDIVGGNHLLLRLVLPALDAQARSASATFAGAAERTARHRPGFGCTLALGPGAWAPQAGPVPRPAAASLSQALPYAPPPPGTQVDRLEAAVARAFALPDANTRVIAVLHDGHVITEHYLPGFNSATPMPGWSMTKTAAAALAGVLVWRGSVKLEQGNLLDEWRAPGDARATITLEHLLRMTDGLAFDERPGDPLSDVVQMLFTTGDASGFAAAKALRAAPGSTWRYANGTTNLLMRALRRASGMSAEAFARFPREALFAPLSMRSAVLEPDATGLPVGSSFMQASAHDWLRFGQFLLQDGVWQGERVLPEGWVRFMRTATPQSRGEYGAHVWLRVPEPFRSRAPRPPALPADAFHLIGHDGQFLSVIPSRNLVVLRLGLTREQTGWDHETFLAQLFDALPDVVSPEGSRPR
jgi:CubicO group peptidase (beta-lactamase class C family)